MTGTAVATGPSERAAGGDEERDRGAGGEVAARSDTPAEQGVPMPEAQLGLWYAQRLDPANPIYNTAQYVAIDGPLDVEAFRSAIDSAMAEADALAVRVIDSADGPRLVIDAGRRAALDVIDLRDAPDPRQAALMRMHDDLRTPLDPTRDALAAQRLFVLGLTGHIWYQRVHHLVIDGYGTALLTARVAALYAARVGGTEAGARPSPLAPFAGVLAADAEYRTSERRERDRRFWLEQFADRPDVPGMAEGRPLTTHSYRRRAAELPASLVPAVHALAARAGAGWPDVVVALSAAYVARHAGGDEAVVGVPSMNRMGAPARVPAMVMNVLPARITIDEDTPLAELVAAAGRNLRRARQHGRYRGEQLRRDLGLVGHDRRLHGPLVNVLPFEAEPLFPGATATLHTLGTGPVDDLTINVRADAAGTRLRLELDANPGLYSEDDLAAHAARLAAFLDAAARAERLADVPTLTAAEHRRWTADVNDTAHPVEDTTLAAQIEATMQRSPDRAAVVDGDRSLTYAELDARSSALVERLRGAGVGRGDVVAVTLHRSAELVVALVAVLRAGAAYLPLDPEYPPARRAAVLDSARPRVLLAPSGEVAALTDADGVAIVPLDGARSGATDAAYVIYTSGSTGTAKGVVVEHQAIVNRLAWMQAHYAFGPDDRVLHKTPTTFDVSVWELFLPLVAGATLVVAPPDAHRDPLQIATLLSEHAITAVHFVPSMLALFLDEPAAAGLAVRRVFCSGEALTSALRDRFHTTVRAELHNLYGPTEAAVDVTYWNASHGDRSTPVPIGRPVWNTRLYVLDARLRPVPPGVPGALHIAGMQLARGYLGRPDLTDAAFVADPFCEPGARMYRTGDVARWRPDGALDYLGRSDHQVKLRGQRIELGEIEAVAREEGSVGHVAVVLREDRSGDQRLVAYVTPAAGTEPDIDALRTHLAGRLPDYMVPSAFVTLDALPLTSSGKLDRRALPPPRATSRSSRAPTSAIERLVADLFAESLGIAPADVGVDDDFFALGGHSLVAARVAARLRGMTGGGSSAGSGRGIGLGDLFTHPTVARLAAHIDAGDAASADRGLGPMIRLAAGDGSGAPALFCVHPAGGIAWCYAPLARTLGARRAVWGVQARGLDPRAPLPASLDEMAADYVAQLRAAQPDGPYHLAGWSAGGIVAHAIAERLRADGATVGVVALLDAYPSDRWRDQAAPDEGAALKALLHIAGIDPATVADGPLTRARVVDLLRHAGHPLGALPDESIEGVIRVVERSNRLVRGHRHGWYDGPMLHFRAALDHVGETLSADDWAPYAASVERHDVPALHAHMTGPEATAQIAAVLAGWLERSR